MLLFVLPPCLRSLYSCKPSKENVFWCEKPWHLGQIGEALIKACTGTIGKTGHWNIAVSHDPNISRATMK